MFRLCAHSAGKPFVGQEIFHMLTSQQLTSNHNSHSSRGMATRHGHGHVLWTDNFIIPDCGEEEEEDMESIQECLIYRSASLSSPPLSFYFFTGEKGNYKYSSPPRIPGNEYVNRRIGSRGRQNASKGEPPGEMTQRIDWSSCEGHLTAGDRGGSGTRGETHLTTYVVDHG